MLNRSYETDLTDAAWELVKPRLPAAGPGGRPRTTDVRAVLNAIVYLLQRVANGACFLSYSVILSDVHREGALQLKNCDSKQHFHVVFVDAEDSRTN